MGKSLSKIL